MGILSHSGPQELSLVLVDATFYELSHFQKFGPMPCFEKETFLSPESILQ
jgi:hypothetical protein